jgi:hypothetical protein
MSRVLIKSRLLSVRVHEWVNALSTKRNARPERIPQLGEGSLSLAAATHGPRPKAFAKEQCPRGRRFGAPSAVLLVLAPT